MEVKEILNEQVDALQIEIDWLVQNQPILVAMTCTYDYNDPNLLANL